MSPAPSPSWGFARTGRLRRHASEHCGLPWPTVRSSTAPRQVCRAGLRAGPGTRASPATEPSHLSAALQHGWKIKAVPEKAWVTIPRVRGQRSSVPEQVHLHPQIWRTTTLSFVAGTRDHPVADRHGLCPHPPLRRCTGGRGFGPAIRKVTAAQLRSAAATARVGVGTGAPDRRVRRWSRGQPLRVGAPRPGLEEGLALCNRR